MSDPAPGQATRGAIAGRVPLAHLPTPLEPLPRFSDWLAQNTGAAAEILIKRDDLTGLALGGNKARKLELLCAEARAQGCDTLVTGGGPQSNHARMTAAAANHLGFRCELAMAGIEPAAAAGNLLLDHLLGAGLHFTGAREYYAIEDSILALAQQVAAEGGRPYAIPVGGASVTGALAYLWAAGEFEAQMAEQFPGQRADWIVVADGSGGTHAGLLAGLETDGGANRVLGVDVGTRPDLDEQVPLLAAEAAKQVEKSPGGEVLIDHDHFGTGYGHPTHECRAARRAMARTEGIVLDPVYTGKAMAGLIAAARAGRFTDSDTVVFWHTGGAPALFAPAYADWITAD